MYYSTKVTLSEFLKKIWSSVNGSSLITGILPHVLQFDVQKVQFAVVILFYFSLESSLPILS